MIKITIIIIIKYNIITIIIIMVGMKQNSCVLSLRDETLTVQ